MSVFYSIYVFSFSLVAVTRTRISKTTATAAATQQQQQQTAVTTTATTTITTTTTSTSSSTSSSSSSSSPSSSSSSSSSSLPPPSSSCLPCCGTCDSCPVRPENHTVGDLVLFLSSVLSSFLPFPVLSSFLLSFVSPINFCRFSFKLLVFVVLLRMVLFFDYRDLLFLCTSVHFFHLFFRV